MEKDLVGMSLADLLLLPRNLAGSKQREPKSLVTPSLGRDLKMEPPQ